MTFQIAHTIHIDADGRINFLERGRTYRRVVNFHVNFVCGRRLIISICDVVIELKIFENLLWTWRKYFHSKNQYFFRANSIAPGGDGIFTDKIDIKCFQHLRLEKKKVVSLRTTNDSATF